MKMGHEYEMKVSKMRNMNRNMYITLKTSYVKWTLTWTRTQTDKESARNTVMAI